MQGHQKWMDERAARIRGHEESLQLGAVLQMLEEA